MNALLHVCCGPCASACVRRLAESVAASGGGRTALYFANSNLDTEEEYAKRLESAKRLAAAEGVALAAEPYAHAEWLREVATGLEDEPERGERCRRCWRYNIGKAAAYAARNGFDAVATSLTVSPHKPSEAVFAAGGAAVREAAGGRVAFLREDFKKRGGFALSVARSRELGLYRQTWCGCEFSRRRGNGLGEGGGTKEKEEGGAW